MYATFSPPAPATPTTAFFLGTFTGSNATGQIESES